MTQEEYVQKVRKIIEKNVFMTIATATPDGEPWVTPVFYSYDGELNFYWYSSSRTKHSQLIAKNKKVAVTIFNSNASEEDTAGVYITGKAHEVEKDDLRQALTIYFERAMPTNEEERYKMINTPEDFLEFSELRMYKLVPEKVFISGVATQWNGKWIDTRVAVKL